MPEHPARPPERTRTMRTFTHQITTLLGAGINALIFGNRRNDALHR